MACTAEAIALEISAGGFRLPPPAPETTLIANGLAPIFAPIPGHMAPGWPEQAAALAYRDARLSHRRQGLYGAMYFAAVIAAAFAVDDPVEALRVGLTEIPRRCALAQAVRWALRAVPDIRNYRQARTPWNAVSRECTRSIRSATPAWPSGASRSEGPTSRGSLARPLPWMDNDCTAATAGSIVGAVVGKKGIPSRWHRRFHDTVH